MFLNEDKRKQEKKKEKLTESLHLTVEMTGGSNYKRFIKASHKQIHCRNHKAAEKPTDSPH